MGKIVEMPDEVDLGNGKKLVKLPPEEKIEWGKGFSIRFDEATYRLVEVDEVQSSDETQPTNQKVIK